MPRTDPITFDGVDGAAMRSVFVSFPSLTNADVDDRSRFIVIEVCHQSPVPNVIHLESVPLIGARLHARSPSPLSRMVSYKIWVC